VQDEVQLLEEIERLVGGGGCNGMRRGVRVVRKRKVECLVRGSRVPS
jgi:hypothetical protein